MRIVSKESNDYNEYKYLSVSARQRSITQKKSYNRIFRQCNDIY
jgi:hypothetical protein